MKLGTNILFLVALAIGLTGCQTVSAVSDEAPTDEISETTCPQVELVSTVYGDWTLDEYYDFYYVTSSGHPPAPFSEEELAMPTDELIRALFSMDCIELFDNIKYVEPAEGGDRQGGSGAYQWVVDDCGRVFVISTKNPYEFWRYFNGFRELEVREDAIPCLLEAYRASNVGEGLGRNGDGYRLMQCLEVVLSQDCYMGRMTDGERTTLYELIEGFHGTDRSHISTEGVPAADQSYRFYPYSPISNE